MHYLIKAQIVIVKNRFYHGNERRHTAKNYRSALSGSVPEISDRFWYSDIMTKGLRSPTSFCLYLLGRVLSPNKFCCTILWKLCGFSLVAPL